MGRRRRAPLWRWSDEADPVLERGPRLRIHGTSPGLAAPKREGLNALEALGTFQASFAGHHQAASANFLVNGGVGATEQAQISDLVAFLKSIDETTTPFAVPAGQDICVGY